jgi:hypothetical protein
MKYHATEIALQLRDRVIYRHLIVGKSQGVVAYIPGVSKVNPRIIPNQWVVRLESGKGVFMAYGADLEFAHRRIVFVGRGKNDSEISSDELI